MIDKRNLDSVLKRILEIEKNGQKFQDFLNRASSFRKNISLVTLRIQNRIVQKDILFINGKISGFMTKKVDEAIIFSTTSFCYYSENYRKNAAIVKYSDISDIRVEENTMTITTNYEERFKVISPDVRFYESMLNQIVALVSSLYSQKLEEEEKARPSTEEDFIMAAAPEVKLDPIVDPEADYDKIAAKKAAASEIFRALNLHSVALVIITKDISLNPNSDIQTKILRLDGIMRFYDETLLKHALVGTAYEPLIRMCKDSDSTTLAFLRHEKDLVEFVTYLKDNGVNVYKKLMISGQEKDLRDYIKSPEEQKVFNFLNGYGISTSDKYTLVLKKNLFAKTSENEDEYEYKAIDPDTSEIIFKPLPETIMENEYYYDALSAAEDYMDKGFEVELTNSSGKSFFELNEELYSVTTSGSYGDEPEIYRQFIVLKNAPGTSPEYLEVKLKDYGKNKNSVLNYVSRAFDIGIMKVNTWIEEGVEPLTLTLDQTLALDNFVRSNGGAILINDGEYNSYDLLNPKPVTNKLIRITSSYLSRML